MNHYAYWRAALDGVFGPITEAAPQAGFYRRRLVRGGPWVPVAIWLDAEDGWSAIVGDDIADVEPTWIACARHPVTHEAYTLARETGSWPGAIDDETPPAGGHNAPPAELTPDDAIRAKVKSAIDAAQTVIRDPIADDTAADACEAHVNKLRGIKGEVEKHRDGLIRPHLEAQRSINGAWKPVEATCDDAIRALRAAAKPYLERKDAERKAAAAAAIAAGQEVARTNATGSSSGTHGRKLSMRTRTVAEITDMAAFLATLTTHPEIVKVAQVVANRIVAAGAVAPGVVAKQLREVA